MSAGHIQSLFAQGRTDEAEQLAKRTLEHVPDDVVALTILGRIALRDGDATLALAHLVRAARLNPADAFVQMFLGRAYALGGDHGAATSALEDAVRLDADLPIARLHLAAALERSNEPQRAVLQYARALNNAQSRGLWLNADTTPPALRPLIEHGVQVVRGMRRETLARVLDPLERQYGRDSLRRVERCLRVHLREELVDYPDERQRPTFLYFPELPAQAYLDRALFAWIETLEANTARIRQELMDLLPSPAGRERVFTTQEIEQQNLRGSTEAPSWNGYYLFRHGDRRDDNCVSCPVTASMLELLPLSHVREHAPEVLFSVFTAGTHLLPHRGVTNTRLVGHLPLIIPENCALKVGGELHEWQEGRAVVFDDTYEHEAWNRSQQIRVVLIFDIWNPHLTEVERAAIAALVPAMGDFRKRVEAI